MVGAPRRTRVTGHTLSHKPLTAGPPGPSTGAATCCAQPTEKLRCVCLLVQSRLLTNEKPHPKPKAPASCSMSLHGSPGHAHAAALGLGWTRLRMRMHCACALAPPLVAVAMLVRQRVSGLLPSWACACGCTPPPQASGSSLPSASTKYVLLQSCLDISIRHSIRLPFSGSQALVCCRGPCATARQAPVRQAGDKGALVMPAWRARIVPCPCRGGGALLRHLGVLTRAPRPHCTVE